MKDVSTNSDTQTELCSMLCKRSEAETSILVGCRIYLVFSASLVAHKSDKSDLSDLPNHVSPHGC